ncbi:MAG: PAS domain S-box protein, partial [Methanomicrobiales archaeon]|nr:PAS domain S-box protein [Methanomicrobiales archaeon]
MRELSSGKALRTTLCYLAAALVWILLSDAVLLALTGGAPSFGLLQTVTGGLFVGATGLLLFLILRREFRAIERRDAQLRDAGQLLRLQSAALESAANAMLITDRQGRITWVNPAFTLLTGYAAEEAIGQNARILKSGQHDPPFYQDLWDTIITGKVWNREIVNRRKDGTLYTAEMTITPVKDAAGAITHFIGIKQDVSERKQAEIALRESEARFRNQVEVTSDWVWEIDERGLYTYVSPKVRDVLGYEPEELVGKSPFDLMPVEEARRVVDLIAPVTDPPKPFRLVENVNLHKQGRRVILETSGTPIFDAHGLFRG